MPPRRKPVIGLIGGMGSGKSLVAAELARHGGLVISGDRLGHEALAQTEIRTRIIQRWGTEVLDREGKVNRGRLAEIVFANPDERRELEALSFPYIERRIGEEIAAGQENPDAKFLVLDAAVMLEAGWNKYCDRLVYVAAPPELRLQRLLGRGLTEKDVRARQEAQWSLDNKAGRADVVLENAGSAEALKWKVEDLMRGLGLSGSTQNEQGADAPRSPGLS